MVCTVPIEERNQRFKAEGLDVDELKNVTLYHFEGNSAVRRHLEALPIQDYTSAMILTDSEREHDSMQADSHSLATLLLLRDIQATRLAEALESMAIEEAEDAASKKKSLKRATSSKLSSWIKKGRRGKEACAVICEILDSRTQRTIQQSRSVMMASDFVQVSEGGEVGRESRRDYSHRAGGEPALVPVPV